MDNRTNLLLRNNIEEASSKVAEIYDAATVSSVFERYNATSLKNLNPRYYSEVFADLEQLIND